MSKRLLLLALLIGLILSGLTASVFISPIQNALTLPAQSPIIVPAPSPKIVPAQTKPNTQPSPPVPTPTMLAQMAQDMLALDTFKRANQSLWGTASDGRPWDGDANVESDVFSVTNHHGQITNAQGAVNALLGPGDVTNADVLLDGSLSHFNGTVNLGVVLRYHDPNNWYKAYIDGTHLIVLKHVDAQSTVLDTTTFAAQDGQSYRLRFRVVGAMLFARAWLSGTPEPTTWMITTTDTTFQSGQAGIRVVLQQGLTVAVTSFAATAVNNNV
jgi:hypothetical protein